MSELAVEDLTKQQLRTRNTQEKILNAAEQVFVRDGYESAQLDEIAAVADRSKGAVYGHFRSKEDLFLALYEHRTRSYIDRLAESLQKCTSRTESIEAFREFYIELAQDKAWSILSLEFKLFALRRPESRKRFRKAFELAKPPRDAKGDARLFGKLTGQKKKDNELALTALGPILSGLILESYFEPENLSDKALRRILGRIFDALFLEAR
jgi:AcrR family transcriptional regulator